MTLARRKKRPAQDGLPPKVRPRPAASGRATIKSGDLRESAGHPDAYCTVQIEGVCGDPTDSKMAGCVLAHWRFSGNAGGAQKPDDLCAGFACGPCHTAMDSNGTTHGIPRGSSDWLFYAFRSTVRTLRWWRDHGFLTVKGDK